MREGDELCVLRLDRLGRSTRDVLNLVRELEERGASLRVLEPELTTTDDIGCIVVTVLGMVAEMERKFILERQKAGVEAAKANGAHKGRRKTAPDAETRRRKTAGERVSDIAREVGISRMTVYRAFAQDEGDNNKAAGGT